MGNSSIRKPCALAFILLFLTVFPLTAESFGDRISWSIDGSILYFPEDNGNAGDPAPILPSLGAAMAFRLNRLLLIEFTEDLYFTNYAYNYTLNRAVPAAIENRSAFVFGFLTGIQALGRFPLGRSMDFRLFMGPAADFRIVTLASNLHPDDTNGNPLTDAQIQTDAVREYFWSKGRWFLPVAGIGMDFMINEIFLLGFDMRVWFPVYRLSMSEILPPIEGWRFGLGLRISPVKAKAVPLRRSLPDKADISDISDISDMPDMPDMPDIPDKADIPEDTNNALPESEINSLQ